MDSKHFPTLAAAAFAALLFQFFLKRRSREINRGEANNDAAANDGTAGGDSGAYTSTGVPENEMATTSGTAGGASGACTSTEGDGTATCEYEVFLSFRGPDTRAGITDHLYTRLTGLGIRTFRDDEDLRKGEEFAPELLEAIKQSKILVPIFSKNYASSVWCLKEIVQMVECTKTGGQKIMPIFYDVAPAEVRYQSERYKEAFLSHEKKKRHDEKTIGEWKAALSAVGEINGWDLHKEGENRREGEFVKQFTREVFNELKKDSLVISDYLVDVDNHVDAIVGMIGAQTNETRIVGIHGMGGVGKTTTAKIIYNRLSENFEGCCFLSNIREMSEKPKGIECLQHQLISDILRGKCTDVRNIDDGIKIIKDRLSNKRVLLLLDDLYEKKHMDELVGGRDWFGKGSKLIITTRNKETLVALGVDEYYELTGMDRDRSLQLFSKHAFKRDSPLDEYINQSNRAIDIAGGLPLALEVIGSLLYCTKKEMWNVRLKMLESAPDGKIQRTLKISYDALEPRQKDTFLDIVCLFIGYDKDILVHFWDEPNFCSELAMEDLQNRSLIKINENNKVWIHDQIRDLGREIVREKSCMKIEKQSRVWDHKQGFDLLRKYKGKKEVEALHLKLDHQQRYCFTYEGLESLSGLRFLDVEGSMENFHAEERLLWHESPSNVLLTNENSVLLPQLRWLSWSDFPPTFNIANFFVEDLVFLNISRSEITDDWKGWSHMKMMKNLKVLIMSGCDSLQKLPDDLGRGLASLEYLSLNSCRSLERLPDSIGNMESLIELDISETDINELPDSIGKLKNLKRLSMECGNISKISEALWTIEKLEEIEASSWSPNFHVNIGNCILKNESLRILKLFDAEIYLLARLPKSLVTLSLDALKMDTFPDLSNLTNLKELDLGFDGESDGLVEYPMPQWIGNFGKLEYLSLCCHFVTTSPTDLNLPPQLKKLHLECPKLRRLPRLSSSLSFFCLERCQSLCSMESLHLSSPYVTTSPTDLTLLPHLHLRLIDCRNLRRLPRLPSSLFSLYLCKCESLCSMVDLSNLKNLSSVFIEDAAIEEIQGLGCLENLRGLQLGSLKQVKILPDLSNLNKLRSLKVDECGSLVEIQGQLPQSLEALRISSCESLLKLPDLSNLKNLSSLHISCTTIEEIQGLVCLGNLGDLRIHQLGQLKLLPDLSNLNKLERLEVRSCDKLVEIQGQLPESLEALRIYSCESLLKLPDLSNLKNLSSLRILCTAIEEIQILGCLGNLGDLRLDQLGQLKLLPDLSNLNKLERLEVRSCDKLVEIQGELPESLDALQINSCESLLKLPDLSNLKNLPSLRISCTAIEEIRGLDCLGNLGDLWLDELGQLKLLPDLSNLNKLERLEVQSCDKLVEIQGELPESLEALQINSCESLLKLPDLSNLKNLPSLRISCTAIEEIQGLGCLGNLGDLQLHQLGQLKLLPDLSNLNKLSSLGVHSCDKLVEIQGKLPESLDALQINSCESLLKLPDLSNLKNLSSLRISCTAIEEIRGLGCLGNLGDLQLHQLGQLKLLPDLSNLNKLERLEVRSCDKLVEIQGELPESLEALRINSCESLLKLPDLSNLKNLSSTHFVHCN